jgi:hypothetical protein
MSVSACRTIRLGVRVPVLSEQRIDMAVRSSMADRLATITPRCTSFFEPIAKVVVVTISIARGIDATKSTIVKERDFSN